MGQLDKVLLRATHTFFLVILFAPKLEGYTYAITLSQLLPTFFNQHCPFLIAIFFLSLLRVPQSVILPRLQFTIVIIISVIHYINLLNQVCTGL